MNLTKIIIEVIIIILSSSHVWSQNYDEMSAFRLLQEEKYDELKSLAETRPELLMSKIQNGVTTALYAAILNRVPALEIIKDENVELLLQKNNEGVTPLYGAVGYNNIEALKFLIQHANSTINEGRNSGVTPMYAACAGDNLEAAKELYKAFPKKEIFTTVDDKGNTPIHGAAFKNAFEVLTWAKSLPYSDIMSIKNQDGKMPIDIAEEKGFKESINAINGIKNNSLAQSFNTVSVIAPDKIVRCCRRWTSARIPEGTSILSFSEIFTNVSTTCMNNWDFPVDVPNYRILFFTSKKNPIKSLQEVNPSYESKEFAYYDASLLRFMEYFVTIAGIGPSNDERANYRFWLRAGGENKDLFAEESTVKLYVTFSNYQKEIEELGGVVVNFVPKK